MERYVAVCGLTICLFGLTGIVIGSIGLTNIPTSLTRDEMYSTGTSCSPERCSQMLTEKQRTSEGVRFSIIGASLFLGSLLCTFAGCIYIHYCSDRPQRGVEPTEQESLSRQIDQQPRHSPSTTGASQPTSVANVPQE